MTARTLPSSENLTSHIAQHAQNGLPTMRNVAKLLILASTFALAACSGGGSTPPTALPTMPVSIHQLGDNYVTPPSPGTSIVFPAGYLTWTAASFAVAFVPKTAVVTTTTCAGVAYVEQFGGVPGEIAVYAAGVGSCAFTVTAAGYAPATITVSVPK